ncbi:topoisomerase [Colwellia sp. 75C3]|uniref:DUF2726 domain-containing protein n=1 Tax=Colwellia sp. 75C3 TaxID=888425 RepID=UPI000C34F883|nr:DUF2726 domain-containing protein [Colwellia sp. 75C3]PKG82775.1 topoisomerase [Colwellia sp. 75C3]
MEFIILFLIFVILLVVLLKAKTTPPIEASYELIGPLFTPAERSFLGTLNLACDDKAVVFGKVRIADILKPQKGLNRSQWQTAFNKISSKHFDFVICNANDLSVLSVIELDDSSHNRKASIKRDELVELACKNASLKLHRFKARATYSVNEIRNTIFEITVPPETESIEVTSITPKCPKCTSELMVKTAQKGNNKGNQFLACSGFPKYRYTEEL